MKLYGLIGYPLSHSFSKKYFEEKFAEENITDAVFELFPLKAIKDFPGVVAENKYLRGLAVTIPYKQSVIPFLSALEPAAKAIGAVNCIKISDDKITGFNTDVIGFENSFLPLLKPYQKKALILGTGGASKAVQFVLQKNRIDFLLVSRNPKEKDVVCYEDIDEDMIWEHPVIINCTPVGMVPEDAEQPAIPYHFLTKDNLLYDLVYKPAKTKFLEQGEKRGCTIKNGFEMLLIQAEENWKIWNDV